MRDRYQKELERLNIALIEMGGMCEEAIKKSVKALTSGDYVSVEKIIEYDREIDRKEEIIESMCIDLIQFQQPVAGDLRLISAAFKIIVDMERIGDQAADIAEIIRLGHLHSARGKEKLLEMAREASKMVTDSIDAFVCRDTQKAKMVIEYDDVVDDLFDEIKKDMVSIMTKEENSMEYVIDMLMVSKYFERIGDHATNIAEWAIYVVSGRQKGEALL